jgi:hypothetical protein
MGVDLDLMPVLSRGSWNCHEMLHCDRDRDLFAAIAALGESLVPEPIWCHRALVGGEQGYGQLSTTPYNTPLTWLPAGKLAPAFIGYSGWRNRAVRAYLTQVPEDWPVVLYWH